MICTDRGGIEHSFGLLSSSALPHFVILGPIANFLDVYVHNTRQIELLAWAKAARTKAMSPPNNS